MTPPLASSSDKDFPTVSCGICTVVALDDDSPPDFPTVRSGVCRAVALDDNSPPDFPTVRSGFCRAVALDDNSPPDFPTTRSGGFTAVVMNDSSPPDWGKVKPMIAAHWLSFPRAPVQGNDNGNGDSNSNDAHDPRPQLQRREDGTWIVPKIDRFNPRPSPAWKDPLDLFPQTHINGRSSRSTACEIRAPRFIHRFHGKQMLIYTDGSCLNNGQKSPTAGWGFVVHAPMFGPSPDYDGSVFGQLEQTGPSGQPASQTSNRAEIRAVIAALQYRNWWEEGWHSVVIATDSTYVADGATKWIRSWAAHDWKRNKNRGDVKNRDLWEELIREVLKYQAEGTDIIFWSIPRHWNKLADTAANEGSKGRTSGNFTTPWVM